MGAVRDMYLCSAPLHCREIHRRVCGAICGEKVSGEQSADRKYAYDLPDHMHVCQCVGDLHVRHRSHHRQLHVRSDRPAIVKDLPRLHRAAGGVCARDHATSILRAIWSFHRLHRTAILSRPTVVDCCHSCRDIRQSSGSWYSFVPSRHSSERVRRHRCADEY